jgi:NAD(P)-dependent dehydrogenase (short-subunit alcohol dehydrogenase family)
MEPAHPGVARVLSGTADNYVAFATNHRGPFGLTEALAPHLPGGGNVVVVASAVEDPERKPAKAAGFRGGRYISAEANARVNGNPVAPSPTRLICSSFDTESPIGVCRWSSEKERPRT